MLKSKQLASKAFVNSAPCSRGWWIGACQPSLWGWSSLCTRSNMLGLSGGQQSPVSSQLLMVPERVNSLSSTVCTLCGWATCRVEGSGNWMQGGRHLHGSCWILRWLAAAGTNKGWNADLYFTLLLFQANSPHNEHLNDRGHKTIHTRVFGNAQTLSWTSGEAICAVYIYEKENYQKTRGQNSKF